jgi:hypothetical protein
LATFTKALPHNHLGEVDPAAYRALLRALRSGRTEDFRRIPLGGRVKLANPEGAFSFELQGPDPWQRPLPPPPRIDSEAFAAEMTECYWLALARDVPTHATAKSQSPPPPSPTCAASPLWTTATWTPAACFAAPTRGCPGCPAVRTSPSATAPPWPAATT